MPRLPMIRVTGSHDISTSLRSSTWVAMWDLLVVGPARVVTRGQRRAVVVPARLFVDGGVGDAAQRADELSVWLDERRRERRARRLVHERHELVGEPRHGAADANAADVGTAADAAHPAALGHVAV